MNTNLPKAPWRISGYGGQHEETGAYIVDADGAHVCSTTAVKNLHDPEKWTPYYATAHLISAAPEMHAALHSLLNGVQNGIVCGLDNPCKCQLCQAKAALAKAEGREA